MRNSSIEIVFGNDTTRKPVDLFYWFSIVLCIIALLFSAVTFFVIDKTKKDNASVIPQFEEALNKGDYDDALKMYRELHDVVVSANPGEVDKYQFETTMMAEMERIISEKTVTIENRIRYERYNLKTTDLNFLNGMEELTNSHLSNWLNSLCEEFLLGTIEKPDITFIFNEITAVDNISSVASPLLREVDTIERASGLVQAAEKLCDEGDYIGSVQTYNELLGTADGFVYDFADRRVEEIKDIMYDPMLAQCEYLLNTFQYYTAESLLSSLAVIFPDDNKISSDLLTATRNTSPVVNYYGSVEVICVKRLIADTDVAFGDNYVAANDDLYLTTSEFELMLEQLYEENYILVDAESLVDLGNDEYLVEKNLVVPEGKKPLIIVIENLDYSVKNMKSGACIKLVVNDQGQVCGQYINAEGDEIVQRSAEAIGILDAFVELHPDFSFNGVKGVISLSGYESCFGYVVDEDQIEDHNFALNTIGKPSENITYADLEANKNTVSLIAGVLKNTGWKFATSTYGSINAAEASMEEIQSDFDKWETQIGSLLGPVHMIVYPNGDYIKGTDPRAEYLKGKGYRIFFGIGPNPYYTYGINYLYYDRVLVNGSALRNVDLSRFIDAEKIYDSSRIKEFVQ